MIYGKRVLFMKLSKKKEVKIRCYNTLCKLCQRGVIIVAGGSRM